MKTRHYHEADDSALMRLEWQSPRGSPTPFVHYRKRFVDRAALFSSYCLLVVEEGKEIIACVAAAIKETTVGGAGLRLAYLFDVRVAPAMRRRGFAAQLLAELEQELKHVYACDGAYAHIVAGNKASLQLFERAGFSPTRNLTLFTFGVPDSGSEGECTGGARQEAEAAETFYGQRDLWVDDVRARLSPFGWQQWRDSSGNASLELYDQSRVFFQVPAASAPPVQSHAPPLARRHGRFFHPVGGVEALLPLLSCVRTESAGEGYREFSLVLDSEELLAAHLTAVAVHHRPYVVVTKAYHPGWTGRLNALLYCDPREL